MSQPFYGKTPIGERWQQTEPLLPNDLKIKIFKFLDGEECLATFEQWVYATNDLENGLTNDDYLKLISLDFSKRSSKYETDEILKRYIDAGEYETWKLRKLLMAVLEHDQNLPIALSQLYELYCDGYYFLDTLGLGYGLHIRVPPTNYSSDDWQGLSHEEQHQLLGSLLPQVISEAQTVLAWLDEGTIVITNKQGESGAYLYFDRRSSADQKLPPC
ncbi:MAG: hypothetical protein KME42_28210 [Tildeniella nuda ZEHNDER 1965/U140]|jgi:hypothetical protein|nr:hypothetical protein [Tildeniella nuda ZEHNDER 1965/U140]